MDALNNDICPIQMKFTHISSMMTLLVYEPLEPPTKNIKSRQQGVRMSHHQPSPGLWCLAGALWALARAEGQKATVHHTDPQTHHHCHTEAAHAGRRHGGHSGENFNVNGAQNRSNGFHSWGW